MQLVGISKEKGPGKAGLRDGGSEGLQSGGHTHTLLACVSLLCFLPSCSGFSKKVESCHHCLLQCLRLSLSSSSTPHGNRVIGRATSSWKKQSAKRWQGEPPRKQISPPSIPKEPGEQTGASKLHDSWIRHGPETLPRSRAINNCSSNT